MLIQLGAGALSALGFAFSWRALQRCRALASASLGAMPLNESDPDETAFEQRLAERETNAALNLARRNVKGLAQAAFTGGLALFFLAMTGGQGHHQEAFQALALGGLGGVACLALRRKIGSLADGWREATNRKRRRQGVDPSERTG